ncbi:hypothetical protein WJX84_001775 [Apatococcus fuscideae]|uniref:Zinc finger protein BRUTUS n=1 Tax=Apatococcus fuscideae TaxID=2026836 RepID=A0AAW1T8Z7_9CHLO
MAKVCLPGAVDCSRSLAPTLQSPPPINFFYEHFHNSIRTELDSLSRTVAKLTSAPEGVAADLLHVLQNRYKFLEQVYTYHSSVEDEVVYPALDCKVRNVTSAYTVEHEHEGGLFEELTQLLSVALKQEGKQRAATIRQLDCKVEEIHTTLRKHLAKEEGQLLPLLLEHFTHAEQAELVAQFLCCIPLAAVDAFLSWLRPIVPDQEQEQLRTQVCSVIPDKLLLQLIKTWLSPSAGSVIEAGGWPCNWRSSHVSKDLRPRADAPARPPTPGQLPSPQDSLPQQQQQQQQQQRPPLQGIRYLHEAIRSALGSFADEARSLRANGSMEPQTLSALVDRQRFLRSVCHFHIASEEDLLLPAARELSIGDEFGTEQCHTCHDEHNNEAALLENLGRLLNEVKASSRRGAKEASELVGELVDCATAAHAAISDHMSREELEVLPVLMKHLGAAEQRTMMWRSLRAMPLRLLERVMPWVAGKLSEAEEAELLDNMRLAAPSMDAALVELLCMWARRGRAPLSASVKGHDDPSQFSNQTCGPAHPISSQAAPKPCSSRLESRSSGMPATAGVHSNSTSLAGCKRGSCEEPSECPVAKQARTENAHDKTGSQQLGQAPLAPLPGPRFLGRTVQVNPIDHIFQFHKALRRDLRVLEKEAGSYGALLADTETWPAPDLLKQLEGRFHFLWGIYRAHSEAEDAIVFPALESKEALHNVSHAYTLDHLQEEQLFRDVHQVLARMRGTRSLAELRDFAGQLQRMCAAMRAALEVHVRAEEQELWPLFAEHFTKQEQEDLVGVIIGRTGAEALQSMLPWVTGSFTMDERMAMVDSLRSATKNTSFERWLEATMQPLQPAPSSSPSRVEGEAETEAACNAHNMPEAPETSGAGAAPMNNVNGVFRPGWEDIFRMNQKQLEVAARRMWADESLEPQRKAYLLHGLMASSYIVAQQRVQQQLPGTPPAPLPQPCPVGITYHDAVRGIPGCAHYKRGAKLVAPCCKRVYTCRHCHDEAEDHRMEQLEVEEMVCMYCGTRQPCAAECHQCQKQLGRYYCHICHLHDDEEGRSIYHCPFCNLCRLGRGLGIDMCHCMHCNACMHLSEFGKHKCRDLSACPVCTEYLFDSNLPFRELPCGHFMHSHCFAQYSNYNYTCPICSKSIGDMTVYFSMIESLTSRPNDLPAEYANRKQAILCNDCERKGETTFHFVYHKCPHCSSYNTRIL